MHVTARSGPAAVKPAIPAGGGRRRSVRIAPISSTASLSSISSGSPVRAGPWPATPPSPLGPAASASAPLPAADGGGTSALGDIAAFAGPRIHQDPHPPTRGRVLEDLGRGPEACLDRGVDG